MQRRRLIAAAALVVVAVGCKGRTPDPTPAAEAPSAEAPAPSVDAAAGCDLAPLPLRLPPADRVVAIGDVHGDLAAARRALRLAGAIDENDRWRGGELVVVQTGDVLDRGDDEPEILALFARLTAEAAAAGGAFVPLLGNHETMNAAGDLRYVTPGGAEDYGGGEARRRAFAPQGPQARLLANYRTAVIVGDTLFAHGGVELAFARDLAATNRAVRCWLEAGGPPPAVIGAEDGPLWSRAFSMAPESCDELERVLGALGVTRMVVGHTPQARINAACEGQVWRIDVGLAAHYGGPTQVLEIRGDDVRVLSASD